MPRIVLSGYISVPAADLHAVRQALPEHIEMTRAESGCLVFKVEEDPAEPGRFSVYEEFENRNAFEFHQARVQASDWGQISRNVKRHYKIDEL
ncbi:MAG: antibiotic biosynthesis monooxygenase [Planctomycetes bacterium]|nr:antibiotic biosynthesis monooxygenase [Planctomycetota bacterium]